MFPHQNDIGSVIAVKACGATNAVAAGTGDATAVTGATINRKTAGGVGYDTCTLALAYRTSLTAAKTLSFAVEVQESADGSSWDTAVALQAATVQATGALTNSVGVLELKDTGFKSRKQYVRYNFTPDLSHTGTDTVDCALVAVLAGADSLPA